MLDKAGIPAAKVSSHWESYLSLSPRFVALRELAGSRSRLEQQVIHFDIGKSVLTPSARDSVRVTRAPLDSASSRARSMISWAGQ